MCVLADVRLISGDLVLRRWQPMDVDALVAGLQDPAIERFTTVIPYPYTAEHGRRFLDEIVPAAFASGGAEMAIVRAGSVVGSIAVRGQGEPGERVGRVGYWVAASARRQGIATRALSLIAAWAPVALGLCSLELIHDVDNIASCRVACRAGFAIDGVTLEDATYRDGTPRPVERHFLSLSGDGATSGR